jgi:8-hydroxy-5-deazaflavin:NADPH oxidoreductase
MKIAVIGSGNVGSAVAKGAQSAGHDVVVTSAGGDMSNAEAVRGADIVVLAVPYGAVSEIAAEIAGEVRGATIVDATNPLTDDYSGLVTEGGASGAERIQQQLPGAKVVKALNTVFAANQDSGQVDGVQLDGFVAGDDAEAKQQALDLLAQFGFRPIDAGGLSAARHLEALGFLNISLNAANGWQWRTGWKLVGPTT